MATATQKQLLRADRLAVELYNNNHPMVAAPAALTVLMNVLEHNIPPEDREAVIDSWVAEMRRHFVVH